MIVYITENNYLNGPTIDGGTIPLVIDEKKIEKTKEVPAFKAWQYNEDIDDFILVDLVDTTCLRERRQIECFNLLSNLSIFWYNNLSETELAEIKSWYVAWLNVTDTKLIPTLPECLSKIKYVYR